VEGTILTVAGDIARAAQTAAEDGCSIPEMLERIVAAADQSVQRSPELLPILREAGVVDAGGKGLFFLLEGMLRGLRGQPLDRPLVAATAISAIGLERAGEYIEEGQDFEVIVDFAPAAPLDLPLFYQRLEEMGTSIQLGQDESLYRLHIHVPTDKRYEPIEYAIALGTVSKVAIENLQLQLNGHKEKGGKDDLSLAPVHAGQIAAVAVSPGKGIAKIFASLGVSAIVPGGQTMNPSTQEILTAFADLPTDKVIILPNNKNIVMAAQQTAALTNKHISVVASGTIPQGIAAMLAFQREGDPEQVARGMLAAVNGVESGEITQATRSVELNGLQLQEGQYIGLHNGELVAAGAILEEALLGLLRKMEADKRELITLYWGEDLTHAEANALADKVRETFPGQEVEIHEGDQPHYFFLLSVE
jgi:DAK2 domain fusion protein YloV